MGVSTSPSITEHRPQDILFTIPVDLLQEFKKEVRIVIKHPWVIGIPAPEIFLNKEILGKLKEFDVMIVPKEIYQ
jgi:hypothetical protein